MEGAGKKAKCFITERGRGLVSWIRFGIEGITKLLLGVEECCRACIPARRPFEWWENGRFFRLESKENTAGRFLLCSVTDGEGKRHSLVFPEGRGFLNGWTMLVEKIRGLGFITNQESKPTRRMVAVLSKGDAKVWRGRSNNIDTRGGQQDLKKEVTEGSSMESAVWLDVGDCVHGKELGSLQSCLIGKWKKKPDPYPAVEVLEDWFKDAWRLNEVVTVAALNADLLMVEFDSPEKAKWVLESGRRSFSGGVLQMERWRPEAGCVRSKDSAQEVWIRVVGLPLHLWKPEILRQIGDACGGFVTLDKNIEERKEVKWARILIKVEGNFRPSVVNILEGPRSYELQIWWEIAPWVTGVYPVSSGVVSKHPEEEEDVETRADKRVRFPGPMCSQIRQWEQAREAKVEKRMGHAVTSVVPSMAGALMRGSGGAYPEICWNKQDGRSILGMGPTKQAENGGGTAYRDGLLSGLKENMCNGPRARSIRGPVGLKSRNGLNEDLKRLQKGAYITSKGAASSGGEFGPVLYGMQAGPSKNAREETAGTRGVRGLKKPSKEARYGPSGEVSGTKEWRRLEEGEASPGVEESSDIMADPAWICARGPLLQASEGSPGTGGTPSFENCWEKGLWTGQTECLAAGSSDQGNATEGRTDGRSLVLAEKIPKSPEVDDDKEFRTHAIGPRFESLSLTECSSPLFSVFGRPLLTGGSSGLGEFLENEIVGDMEPLRVVSVDGSEWGTGIDSALTEDGQESAKEKSVKIRPESMGYDNWEDSCLLKFSEFLGVKTVGFEEEILNLMRKLETQQEGDKRKDHPTETRCERELRKSECTINYSGKSQNRGGRDRGNFLLKLK